MNEELVSSGRRSVGSDTLTILKSVDDAIKDEKDAINSINRCILTLDIVVTSICAILIYGN